MSSPPAPPPPRFISSDTFHKTIRYLVLHLLPYSIIRTWNDKLPLKMGFVANHNPVNSGKLTSIQDLKLQDNVLVQALFQDCEKEYSKIVAACQTFNEKIFSRFQGDAFLPFRISCYAGNWVQVTDKSGQLRLKACPNLALFAFSENEPYFRVKGGWGDVWKTWNQEHYPISKRVNADQPKEKVIRLVFHELLNSAKGDQEEKASSPSKHSTKRKDPPKTKAKAKAKTKAKTKDSSDESNEDSGSDRSSSEASSSSSSSPSSSSSDSSSSGESSESDSPPAPSPKKTKVSSVFQTFEKTELDTYPIPLSVSLATYTYTQDQKALWEEINFVSQFLFYVFKSLATFVTSYDLEHLFVLWIHHRMPKDLRDTEGINFDRVVTLFTEQTETILMYKMYNELLAKYLA